MLKRVVLTAFCLLVPSVALAQTAQENYLPAKSQFYFRWDGMSGHQAAYEKTAAGKMMQGETGVFLKELWKHTEGLLLDVAANDPKFAPALKDMIKLINSMYQDGLVFGLDVERVLPPSAEAVLVFPKGAGESGVLLPLIQKIGEETKADIKNVKVGKRFVNSVELGPVKLGWWAQGPDALIYLGTNSPVDYAKSIDAKQTGIVTHPLYKKVVAFKEFPTCTRGFFDMQGVLKVAADAHPQAKDIIKELGLYSIKSVTFVNGFDGPADHSIVDIDAPGPRTGLMSLGSQKKISFKDFPKLPSDVDGFSASSISINKTYDMLTTVITGVVRVFDGDKADDIKEGIKAFEGAVGVDVSKELFGSFGDFMITYSAPSDGFLGTGTVYAFQIKDGKKLDQTIQKLVKGIPAFPGGALGLKKKTYHGGELLQLEISGGQADSHIASFGVYKNWFVYSSYPQPIKGFILRQEGVLTPWKSSESLTKALTPFPKEFNAIRVSDPRPTVETLMSLAPFVINLANTLGSAIGQIPGAPALPNFRPFDLELIPNAQETTRHLFPNVTITIDDGKRIRTQTRGSL